MFRICVTRYSCVFVGDLDVGALPTFVTLLVFPDQVLVWFLSCFVCGTDSTLQRIWVSLDWRSCTEGGAEAAVRQPRLLIPSFWWRDGERPGDGGRLRAADGGIAASSLIAQSAKGMWSVLMRTLLPSRVITVGLMTRRAVRRLGLWGVGSLHFPRRLCFLWHWWIFCCWRRNSHFVQL